MYIFFKRQFTPSEGQKNLASRVIVYAPSLPPIDIKWPLTKSNIPLPQVFLQYEKNMHKAMKRGAKHQPNCDCN